MADKSSAEKERTASTEEVGAPPVSEATDGGDSRLTTGYRDNPDKPDESSIAQVEEVKVEERA